MSDSPIRVLCVFGTLNRGGAETMCMNLLRNIDRDKVVFDFVKHTSAKCDYEDEIIALGGKIYAAPAFKVYNYFSYRKWWREFLKQHEEYHIVHSHTLSSAVGFMKVARKAGRYTIIHVHSTGVRGSGIAAKVKLFLAQKSYSDALYRFACSDAAGKWLYKDKSFTVINNAVDSARFTFDADKRTIVREQLGISKDEKAIFVVASLSEVKNPLGALDIYSAIRRRNPNARLFWAGEGGMRGPMEQKIATEQIPGVTLLGTRSDVPDLLQAADAFMLCSFSEGLPVVTIEAQAAGLPCLLSSAVTTEAAVTDLCTFLPIDQPELWADAAEKALTASRRDTRPEIIRAGYDIKETSAWLTNFYLNCKG